MQNIGKLKVATFSLVGLIVISFLAFMYLRKADPEKVVREADPKVEAQLCNIKPSNMQSDTPAIMRALYDNKQLVYRLWSTKIEDQGVQIYDARGRYKFTCGGLGPPLEGSECSDFLKKVVSLDYVKCE